MDIAIENHCVKDAPFVPTTKMGGGITPLFIVMHYTAGWTSEGDIQTLARDNVPASAHGVLSRDGKWTQIVPFNKKAWHAGPSRSHGYTMLNDHAIGIEISNAGWIKATPTGFVDQYGNTMNANGQFDKSKRRTFSDPANWVHRYHPRLARGDYAWEPFYPEQLDYLDKLVRALLFTYPSIKFIVSHEEIDTRGWKTDPGPMFPMARYTELVDDTHQDLRTFVVAIDDLNMRSGPGTQNAVIRQLRGNDRVTEIDRDGDWMHVKTGAGYDGWVAHRYLRQV